VVFLAAGFLAAAGFFFAVAIFLLRWLIDAL
jgi:hypothetical protein